MTNVCCFMLRHSFVIGYFVIRHFFRCSSLSHPVPITPAPPLLRMSDIHKSYPGVHALKGSDWSCIAARCSHYWAKTALGEAR